MNLAIDMYNIQRNKTKEEAKQNSLVVTSDGIIGFVNRMKRSLA